MEAVGSFWADGKGDMPMAQGCMGLGCMGSLDLKAKALDLEARGPRFESQPRGAGGLGRRRVPWRIQAPPDSRGTCIAIKTGQEISRKYA